ncbi:MAG: phosphopyruvate hydratase [Candidatus Heimdallarchaeota archaeon]
MQVKAREIFDTNVRPLLEVEVLTKGGILGSGSAPCGSSVGKHEAITLRDGDPRRYSGLGVLKAVQNVNQVIAPKLIGTDVREQRKIDQLIIDLDGTENKSKLGGNTILSVSYAVAEAAANAIGIPLYQYIGGITVNSLPIPIVNLVNGGPFSPTDMAFQEHGIVPTHAKSLSEALRMCVEVNFELKNVLKEKYGKKGLAFGQSHGYSPPIQDSREAFDRILEAIEEVGYGGTFVFHVDSAASQFYDMKKERYSFMGREITREDLIEFYRNLVKDYPIFTIEDPLYEDDFEGHVELTKELSHTQIVGDDLFVTNVNRLKKGIKMKACNAIILKPNQVGSLSETFDVARLAVENDYQVIPAVRSSRCNQPIPDIAVGLNCRQVKFAPLGYHRCVYNRLLRIEENLGDSKRYTNFVHIRR